MLLRYTVEGLGTVEHELLGMGERALEPGPVLTLIGKAMQRIEQALFDSGGNGQWPPLAASTVAMKGNSKILRDTDALMDSLTSGDSFEVNGSELLFFTDVTSDDGTPYPSLLKSGTSRMPPRDPLPTPSGSDIRMFSKAIQAYIIGQERAEFGAGDFALGSLDPMAL